MRSSYVVLLGVVALLVSTPPYVSAKSDIPDVKVLIPRAMDLLTARFPGAIFYEAEGLPAEGQVAWTADDIVEWQFAFGTPESTPFLSAIVRYGPPPHGFSPVVGKLLPFTGALPLDKAPPVTLKGAVKLLRRAGFTCAFNGVILVHPLIAEPVNPRYLFQCIGLLGGIHHVAVDTVTRDVFLVD